MIIITQYKNKLMFSHMQCENFVTKLAKLLKISIIIMIYKNIYTIMSKSYTKEQFMSSKKKNVKFKKWFSNLLSLVFIVASGFILYEAGQVVMKQSQTKKDLMIIKEEINEIEQENENLLSLKAKLSDSNYVQNYARGKHLMSKSEEQVFILPKPKE